MLPVSGTGMNAAGGAASEAADPRLKTAAHEFEASLMKELLEPLQHDPLFDEGTDAESAEGSDNSLMSYGSEALAQAISDRGGFGIADKILAHFAQQQKAAEKGAS
jgi:Rod binding domain-containing protein